MEPWLVECARCKRIVHGYCTHLFWSPERGAFRLCRSCRNLTARQERLELSPEPRKWEVAS